MYVYARLQVMSDKGDIGKDGGYDNVDENEEDETDEERNDDINNDDDDVNVNDEEENSINLLDDEKSEDHGRKNSLIMFCMLDEL